MLGNKLIRARKRHYCDWCGQPIEPGEKYWRWGWVNEDYDTVSTVRAHPECEEAWAEECRGEGGYVYATGDAERPPLLEGEGN